jgi:hypothetical protein
MKQVKLSPSISRKEYRYPLYRMLGGPQSPSRRFWKREKLLLLLDFKDLTFQPVANRYTDYTIAVLRGYIHWAFTDFFCHSFLIWFCLETKILSSEYPFVGNYRRNNFHINKVMFGRVLKKCWEWGIEWHAKMLPKLSNFSVTSMVAAHIGNCTYWI